MIVSSILADPAYAELKRHILGHTGLAYFADKDEDLASRLARRFAARGIRNCSSYLMLLMGAAAAQQEMDALIGELTIGETYFFRQRPQFDLLRDTIFPDLLDRNRAARRLRVWSAGCATGAEPYSISMLLHLELADRIQGWEISILGTDINPDFLARARAARFDDWAFREVPDSVKLRCFERDDRGWVLRPEFRSAVAFRQYNLVGGGDPPGGGPFDLVLCRNVMIYFDAERVRHTVARFYDALAPGGWLLVGHAEPNPEVFQRFRTVCSAQATGYQKAVEQKAAEQTIVSRGVPVPRQATQDDRLPHPLPPAPRRKPPVPAVLPPSPVETVEEARALADRGRWREAADLCRKLIRADSLNAAARFTLGAVLEHSGSREEAAREFQRAIYLDRAFALAHYHFGMALQSAHPARARKSFEAVLDLLAARPSGEPVEHGDGITAAELADLARMHLEVIGVK